MIVPTYARAVYSSAMENRAIDPSSSRAAKQDELRLTKFEIDVPSNLKPRPVRIPTRVLLTGCPGFLATFLLRELIDNSKTTIYCFGRPSKGKSLKDRCTESLQYYSLARDLPADRVLFVEGDLAQPNLGMSVDDFDRVAREVDTIFHCAAFVNHVYNYTSLETANVFGFKEVLRLAATHTEKIVNFVSSAVVMNTLGNLGLIVSENEPLPASMEDLRLMKMGYPRTKWAAEKLAESAAKVGIKSTIFRPGHIGWHSISGAWNPNDFMCGLLRISALAGAAPRIDLQWDVAPIDYVARSMSFLAQDEGNIGRNFHMNSPYVTSWNKIVGTVQTILPDLKVLPFHDWILHLQRSPIHEDSFAQAITGVFCDQINGVYVPRRHLNQPLNQTIIGTQETVKRLAGSKLCPPPDEVYFRPFIKRVLSGTQSPE